MKKKIQGNCLLIMIFLLCGAVLNRLFIYDDHSIWSTNSRVETYEKLPKDSLDVLFVGSSNIMSAINPVQLWNETGIQSYNFCSRAQTFPFTYAYLYEALKSQTPNCIVIDAYSVISDKSVYNLINSEVHLEMNLSSLKFSTVKYEIMKQNLPLQKQILIELPIIKNHSRYKNWFIKDDTDDIYMGYCFVEEATALATPTYSDKVAELQEVDKVYIDKIIQLCDSEGIELIIIKTPVVISEEQHQVINGLGMYIEEYGVQFYDCSEGKDINGFDFETDMMDGIHLNKNGAKKMTSYIARILGEIYDFKNSDRHQYNWIWKDEYERMKLK